MRRMHLGFTVGFFCFLFSGGNPCAAQQAAIESATAAPVMEVRYFDRGKKDARHAYKYQLIHEVLEATRAEYGDYKVVPFGAESSAKRQALLLRRSCAQFDLGLTGHRYCQRRRHLHPGRYTQRLAGLSYLPY